jgi:hypothetical protein
MFASASEARRPEPIIATLNVRVAPCAETTDGIAAIAVEKTVAPLMNSLRFCMAYPPRCVFKLVEHTLAQSQNIGAAECAKKMLHFAQ